MSATGPELKIGQTIPGTKYRVVRSLGAGGMGVVYQVEKPPNIGGVLKLMSTELTRHQEHRLRFFDEVRILAQLDHPNIVKVFDYDALPDGTPFYVMELLTGRTVRDVTHTMGRVPPRVAYEVTRQLLEALQCAHTHQIPVIHRDIKPENIFLHAPRHGEPVVKLIDFGVSALADRTHDGAFVGTWSYAAPEQIRGEKPTPATDLYAVGLVLYEMLAGVGPFDHYEEWTQVSEAQLNEIPAPVSKFAPWVPASIVALIASALAKDPKMRPRDAYAFAERLFELEWASDGKDPHDMTAEGPSADAAMARVNAHRAGAAPVAAPVAAQGAAQKLVVGGNGPLSRVLSTVTGAGNPSSKNMAAAAPATDRLGDVPLIGVPPESVRSGPTWQGVGGGRHEMTSPDADALLAGLGAVAGKPPSKRERASDPDVLTGPNGTPRIGQVVIRAGKHASSPQEDHGPTTPRASALALSGVATMDEVSLPATGPIGMAAVAAPSTRDTFSSQSSDARRALPRSRTGLYVAAGALLLTGLVVAMIVILRAPKPPTVNAGTITGATSSVTSAETPLPLGATAALPPSVVSPPGASAASPSVEPAVSVGAGTATKTPGPHHSGRPPSRTATTTTTATPAPPTTTAGTSTQSPAPAPKGSNGEFIRTF